MADKAKAAQARADAAAASKAKAAQAKAAKAAQATAKAEKDKADKAAKADAARAEAKAAKAAEFELIEPGCVKEDAAAAATRLLLRLLRPRSAAAAKREADGKKYDVFFDDGQTEQSVKREEFLPGRRLLPKQAVCVRFEDDVTYYGRIVRRVGRDFPARYIVRFKNGDMQEGLVESEVLPGHRR